MTCLQEMFTDWTCVLVGPQPCARAVRHFVPCGSKYRSGEAQGQGCPKQMSQAMLQNVLGQVCV